MWAAVCKEKEQPLVFEQVENQLPTEQEVLVSLQAAALNHRDWWIQQGMYANLRYPIILGSDGAGTVTAVGSKANEHLLSKEVIINPGFNWGSNSRVHSNNFTILGLPHNGTFAQQVVVPASNVVPKPSYLSWHQAAAIPLAALTGYRALFTQGQITQGTRVLITGIGGGVALLMLQMAVAVGAQVYVTSSSDDKIAKAIQLGAIAGINYTISGWHKLFQASADGFDVIIDSAAGDGFKNFIDLTNPGGRIVFFGGTQGAITQLNPQKIFWKQLQIIGTTMGTPQEFAAMVQLFETHKIEPVIDEVFDLENADAALQKMGTGNQFGKIVLQIPQNT
ncbi:MAG: alcohol dehydrogenase [Bacteroidetes bacterium]|nr:MAG: alcohol dehydrogenase [Bacteroidota bacterium]TAE72134.1 MAG: alcohol dehydrogenase [Bacteroidota bacterium]